MLDGFARSLPQFDHQLITNSRSGVMLANDAQTSTDSSPAFKPIRGDNRPVFVGESAPHQVHARPIAFLNLLLSNFTVLGQVNQSIGHYSGEAPYILSI
jgi:hypothetical protein